MLTPSGLAGAQGSIKQLKTSYNDKMGFTDAAFTQGTKTLCVCSHRKMLAKAEQDYWFADSMKH